MQLLPRPAYSSDMLPIEHVWDLVGRRLARDPRSAASKDEILLGIQAIWNSLPQANIQNLFDCMPRRVGFESQRRDVGVCKCIVPCRHGGILNSRRAASPLERLIEREER
ncbi:transposable element Tcb1 transposase [Trichonephila clavipes]|nr:transposable element Tcb1 transposase [Trichonephila clavipes]